MATRFDQASGLDELVARLVASRVEALGERVESEARRRAPGLKRWITIQDSQTRREHREAHDQEVPTNLRFVLRSPAYDRAHYGAAARQQLRRPRDRAGTPGLVIGCRCQMVTDPQGLARRIHRERATIAGTRVRILIISTGPRVLDAEYGGDGDAPARYMGGALRAAARSGSRR